MWVGEAFHTRAWSSNRDGCVHQVQMSSLDHKVASFAGSQPAVITTSAEWTYYRRWMEVGVRLCVCHHCRRVRERGNERTVSTAPRVIWALVIDTATATCSTSSAVRSRRVSATISLSRSSVRYHQRYSSFCRLIETEQVIKWVNVDLYCSLLWTLPSHLSSSRRRLSGDVHLEVRRKYCQNCTMLCCVQQLCTIHTKVNSFNR